VEVGSTARLTLERAATGGAVGRTEAGQVVFARLGLPGEQVVVEITESTSRFARGEVVEVVRASADRVEPPCGFATAFGCGGCDLQHATADAQRRWKSDVATEHLRRITQIAWRVEVEAVGGDAHGSRTRLRCAVDEEGRLGLRRSRSHEIVALERCWLADGALTAAMDTRWTNAVEVELRAIGPGEPFAVARWPQRDPVVHETLNLAGEPLANARSRVRVGADEFEVGPLSFWQSHRRAPELLSGVVLDWLDAQEGDRVCDLYSGVGLFAVPLARRVGPRGRVLAVEGSAEACADAMANADGQRQLTVRPWRVSPRAINDTVGVGELVVLDPPRSGAGLAAMRALAARRPRRIVYVSCDAATLARDLGALLGDYDLRELRAFDLFPMTEHLELVAVLDARG
jgi:tRNA/tmRNA/rRNA uracil-C5-methylase (TrmA/RlmC/RlmD family)